MRRLMPRRKLVGLLFLLGCFYQIASIAQTPTGSISGVIKDESGAVVPGATVAITNVATGVRRTVPSDAGGRYRVPGLDPGPYRVEVQAAGFQTAVRQGVELTVGREIEIEMLLRLGQVEQVTEVTAEAPLVETVTNTLSGLVDEETIRELPLNGRSFDHLIALQPGVHTLRSADNNPSAGFGGQNFSVGGSRTTSNLFLMDGLEMPGAGSQSVVPGGILGKNMGVDAIQEFTVLLGNYSAAYGKRNGGIVNIVTRPGTNQLHGSGFEFFRNDNLDARNFFDPNPEPPEFRRNQFGGSVGGALRQDKTFFFGTYEGLREGLGETNIAIVPDNNARQGFLPDPANPGQLINVGVSGVVRPFIPALFELPNGRNFADGTAEYNASPTAVSRQDFFLVRMDHHLSEKDSLFGRYTFTDAALLNPDESSLFAESAVSRSQSAILEAKRVYPTTLNIARFGFSRARSYKTNVSLSDVNPSLRFIEGAPKLGSVLFSVGGGSASLGALTRTGMRQAPVWTVVNQFEFSDQVFHYHGRHSLQFGLNIQRLQVNINNAGSEFGEFEFDSLRSFLIGQPVAFRGVFPGSDAIKAYRRIYFAGFAQDDFKILPRLTLNLGLRYELMTVPVEASGNRISNYRRTFVNGLWAGESDPVLGSPFWKGDHNLWAPRVGFAWDPFGDGKTGVRGGFGVIYDQVVAEYFTFTGVNLPFYKSFSVNNPPFPLGFSGGTGAPPLPTAEGMDFDLDTPTKLQWNFSIERQLTANSVINLAYLGSHSYHLTRRFDLNATVPEILPDGTKFYSSTARVRNPALGRSRMIVSDANGFYQGLQTDFVQQVSQGLRAKVSYTFSKAIDESSVTFGTQGRGDIQMAQDSENRRADRGLSAFDVRHTLTTNFTYDLPGGGLNGLPGKLVGGWQLGSIITANTGEPFTAVTGFSRSRNRQSSNADKPNLRAGASNSPVLGGPDRYFDPNAFELPPAGFYGNLGRNTVIGPGFVNVDMSLVKITPVGERFRTEFRAEFFNLLNHANFGLPSTFVFNSNGTVNGSAGRITNTSNTSRQIQFGLKLSF
jgi:hypothetical protein